MDSQTPLTNEEKEAVLKMAGVLIRTMETGSSIYYRAGESLIFSESRNSTIRRAFNKLIREQTK